MVVHGHTITKAPVIRANRIGIDTGAYASDRLTALGLQGTDRWFLATEPA
jgi:serine/threonine protein phosphatase 1